MLHFLWEINIMATKKAEVKKITEIQKMDAPSFKRAKAITVPSLSIAKMAEGDSVYVRIESEIINKEDIDQKTKKVKIDTETGEAQVLHIARVINLLTGELCDMVLGFVAYRALYEYGDYVGKSFEFLKGEKKGRTNMWSVFELEA